MGQLHNEDKLLPQILHNTLTIYTCVVVMYNWYIMPLSRKYLRKKNILNYNFVLYPYKDIALSTVLCHRQYALKYYKILGIIGDKND